MRQERQKKRRSGWTGWLTVLCLCCTTLTELNPNGSAYAERLTKPEALCPRSGNRDSLSAELSRVSESVAIIQSGNQIGNGVVISPQGLLLTASHVLKGNRRATAYLAGKEAATASLVHLFDAQDLALMRLEGNHFPCVPLADRLPAVQSPVLILTFQPEDSLRGVLYETAVERMVSVQGQGLYILLNLNLRAGNSGSPIFSEQGELVGIVSEKMEQVPIPETKHRFRTLGTSTLFLKNALKTRETGY